MSSEHVEFISQGQKIELTQIELTGLYILVEHGPLLEPDALPELVMLSLIEKGLAARVIINRLYGNLAATHLGAEFYMTQFEGKSLLEAIAHRKMKYAIARFKHQTKG